MTTTQAVKRYLNEKMQELIGDLPTENQLEVIDNLIQSCQNLKQKLEFKAKEDKPTPAPAPTADPATLQ